MGIPSFCVLGLMVGGEEGIKDVSGKPRFFSGVSREEPSLETPEEKARGTVGGDEGRRRKVLRSRFNGRGSCSPQSALLAADPTAASTGRECRAECVSASFSFSEVERIH